LDVLRQIYTGNPGPSQSSKNAGVGPNCTWEMMVLWENYGRSIDLCICLRKNGGTTHSNGLSSSLSSIGHWGYTAFSDTLDWGKVIQHLIAKFDPQLTRQFYAVFVLLVLIFGVDVKWMYDSTLDFSATGGVKRLLEKFSRQSEHWEAVKLRVSMILQSFFKIVILEFQHQMIR